MLFNFRFKTGGSELTGATNLMAYYGLEHSYSKFSGKKVKEQLSSFLPNLPGVIDGPGQIVSKVLDFFFLNTKLSLFSNENFNWIYSFEIELVRITFN